MPSFEWVESPSLSILLVLIWMYFCILFVLYMSSRSTLTASRLLTAARSNSCCDWRRTATLPVVIGPLVRAPSSNHRLAKFCCGRRMRRRWLNLDSPASDDIFAMELLQRNERSRRGLVLLAMVFGLCFDPVSCFGQNLDSEFTFLLPAGRSDCFFQTAVKNGTMEIEYQVTVLTVSRHKHRVCSHTHAVWNLRNTNSALLANSQ